MTKCPTPECLNELENDSIVCPDCYFQIPKHLTRFLVRMRRAARRAVKPEDQTELQERFEANLRGICRDIKVPEKKRATA